MKTLFLVTARFATDSSRYAGPCSNAPIREATPDGRQRSARRSTVCSRVRKERSRRPAEVRSDKQEQLGVALWRAQLLARATCHADNAQRHSSLRPTRPQLVKGPMRVAVRRPRNHRAATAVRRERRDGRHSPSRPQSGSASPCRACVRVKYFPPEAGCSSDRLSCAGRLIVFGRPTRESAEPACTLDRCHVERLQALPVW